MGSLLFVSIKMGQEPKVVVIYTLKNKPKLKRNLNSSCLSLPAEEKVSKGNDKYRDVKNITPQTRDQNSTYKSSNPQRTQQDSLSNQITNCKNYKTSIPLMFNLLSIQGEDLLEEKLYQPMVIDSKRKKKKINKRQVRKVP